MFVCFGLRIEGDFLDESGKALSQTSNSMKTSLY